MKQEVLLFEELISLGIETLRKSGFPDGAILAAVEKAGENKIGDIKADMWQEVYKEA